MTPARIDSSLNPKPKLIAERRAPLYGRPCRRRAWISLQSLATTCAAMKAYQWDRGTSHTPQRARGVAAWLRQSA